METNKINGGLLPTLPDERDFSLGGIFGTIDLKTIPDNFIVAEPLKMKDQKQTDFCAAYTTTSISEDQEGVELSPAFQFFVAKKISGDKGWGVDLRTICSSLTVYGSLKQSDADTFLKDPYDRNTVLNPNTWPNTAFTKAREHAKSTYFTATGYDDIFDAIRASLWQFREEKRTIACGALWRNDWTIAPKGIIPKKYGDGEFGHAFKIFGQKKIGDELYLVAQLSNGLIGDRGLFYFPREVVNKELTPYKAFMFQDMDKNMAEYYRDHGIKITDNWFIQLVKALVILFK